MEYSNKHVERVESIHYYHKSILVAIILFLIEVLIVFVLKCNLLDCIISTKNDSITDLPPSCCPADLCTY